MGQVNVNPPSNGDGGAAAAAGMSMGMMLMVIIGIIVLLVIAYFLLRPLVFGGGTSNINVTVRSAELVDALRLLA